MMHLIFFGMYFGISDEEHKNHSYEKSSHHYLQTSRTLCRNH